MRPRSSATTGNLPLRCAASTAGTRSCGTVKTTSIGVICVMLAMPVALLLLTRLPGSTARSPMRPLMGARMLAKSTFSAAARSLARSASTTPSSCLTSAACVSTSWRAMESCASSVW